MFHQSLLASIGDVQVEQFMTVQDQPWNMTDNEDQSDENENHFSFVF